jgi:hypothetical protein
VDFRIADTFTDSLSRLNGDEQKAVKTTAFDLQLNPAHPSLQFHRLDKPRDPRFWSIRVNLDIRMIVHRTESSLLLCYVGHHDQAYAWAERRKLETHPKTGAAQLVEIRETVQEIIVPRYVEVAKVKPALFAHVSESELLRYGVPQEWLADVRAADEDSLLILADHLPAEAAEALLDLATGTKPKAPAPAPVGVDPFAHPDAQRRFRTLNHPEELKQALEAPWEKWVVFLHPAQRQFVERDFGGPARVSGSAGTGKTIVALHRAAFLAKKKTKQPVLLTTFSPALANALREKLRLLDSTGRVQVEPLELAVRQLYEQRFGPPSLASREEIARLIREGASNIDLGRMKPSLLQDEWEQVVDPWQLKTWEEYRDVSRLGRKTRLPEKSRAILWQVFEKVRSGLEANGLLTLAGLYYRTAQALAESEDRPFSAIVVDEAQDVSIPQLRLLAALGGNRPNSLFFAGDLGQRIFQQPFSWKELGIDIRGRSTTLKINYRTSHQIRKQADRLLGPEVADVDGNTEDRKGTISVFNGAQPVVQIAKTADAERAVIEAWLRSRIGDGLRPEEIALFVRSEKELSRARKPVQTANLNSKLLDEDMQTAAGHVSIGTMHAAKGLEFRAVAVVACDGDIIPSQERIEALTDDADLEEVYNTERHLLYVACTRARDYLLVTGAYPGSEFLDDLQG